ncbi:MAG: hypothetical protein ACR2FP_11200 [Nocardioidaceae bacterium]
MPKGALHARICPTGKGASADWSAPLDALDTGIDELASMINGLPPQTDEFCQGSGGLAYALTLQYSDGSLVTVRGDTGGCSDVVVGDTLRAGASGPLAKYFDLLRGSAPVAVATPTDLTSALSGPNLRQPLDSPMAQTGHPSSKWQPSAWQVSPAVDGSTRS